MKNKIFCYELLFIKKKVVYLRAQKTDNKFKKTKMSEDDLQKDLLEDSDNYSKNKVKFLQRIREGETLIT